MKDREVQNLSDREIDLLVAARLLGYRWFHCVADTGVERNQFCSPDEASTWRRAGWELTAISSPPESEFNDSSSCLLFSTDIASAMQVVEKMRERDLLFKLVSQQDGTWVAFFWKFGEQPPKFWAINESKERAICEAALAALEGTKEE